MSSQLGGRVSPLMPKCSRPTEPPCERCSLVPEPPDVPVEVVVAPEVVVVVVPLPEPAQLDGGATHLLSLSWQYQPP